VAEAPGEVLIRVRDTGQGIAPELLPHVFNRFWQAEPGASRRHEGLGLGLTIVRQLVELHGGAVTAASDGVGKGAEFTVRLPRADEPALAAPSEPMPAPPPAPDLLAGVRVLLIEDEPDALDVLRQGLEAFGASVTAVDTGLAALRVVGPLRPHVVLSDIGLRDVDGYELLRRLREASPHGAGDLRAVALTGYARREDRERALAAGFRAHVAKPVDPATLAVVIRTVL
jgi:CheY-like chemotaxis protein